MASFSVVLKPSVEKDLRSLSKSVLERVWARIVTLPQDPRPRQSAKLAGTQDLYRVRVGDHRIVYGVDDTARQIVIHYVRHRSDSYR